MVNCCNGTAISLVAGNDVLLLARVYEKTLAVGETDGHTDQAEEESGTGTQTVIDTPFDLTTCEGISVMCTNGYNEATLEWAIAQDESNCLAVSVPHTLTVGEWAVEITCKRNGYHVRSFEFTFRIVETNCEAQTTFEVVDGCQSASVRVALQIVPQAFVRGQNSYEMWKELPGNEDKTLQDYIDEVLDLNGVTANAVAATEAANEAAERAASTESDIKTAEAVRVTAETGRVSNENTRIVNEEAREGRETVRENNESGRVQSEFTRVQSEFSRVQAERGRVASETNREEAEAQRESDCAAAVRAANAAAANANDKAALADEKATLAGEKAALADEKAGLADTKAALADAAAANANTKAALANEKAILAKTAAANADEKAVLADEKAALAEDKATEAARVNAVLSQSEGAVILTVTDRDGASTAKEVGFRIAKTYASISAMNADAANVDEGRFVLIASTVEDVDNAKLYVKNGQGSFTYLTDLSGATGLKGDDGKSATVAVGTVTGGATAAVTNSGTQYDAVLNFVLPKGEDGVGIVSITYKDTDAQGGNVYTVLLDNGHSYDITCPKGDASTADINLNGSIISVTNNEGVTKTIDVLSSTDERVQITVTTDVPGVSVAGLTINAYYNNASVPTATCTTDANGMAVLSVPNGYKYRLVFPTIQGCKPIADVVHTASVSQRSVEVEYQVAAAADNSEHVIVQLLDKRQESYVAITGETVTLTYDGQSHTAVTDSTGKATFDVPYGKQYVVTAPTRNGYYIVNNAYTKTFTSAESSRAMDFIYKTYNTGLFIVPADGMEYRLDEWEAAVEGGTRLNSEALYIKVATSALASNGGTFCVEIDTIRERSYGATKQWCTSNVQFSSIPLNGNSASAAYYYDGLTASRLIKAEAVERSLSIPAFDVALGESRTIGNETANGFIGSVGQWSQLWANRSEIDDILLSVRPNGTYLLSTLTTQKWTSTQNNANSAWCWGTAATNNYKKFSYVVLPFFAY